MKFRSIGNRSLCALARAGTAIAPLALAAIAAPASAQSAEPQPAASEQDASATGDIIVTAQRRSESSMRVPVAITAFSGEALAKAGIGDIKAMQMATPTLVFTNTGAYAQPYIRGVGSRLLQNGFDPSVAVYVDGRYLSRQSAISLDLFDTQRVEVLKGPQGVLFGRNASAGAIRVITNEVSGKDEGAFRVGYGNYNQLTAEAMANLRLSDSFGIRLSGLTIQHDGYATNIVPKGAFQWDDKHLTAVRGKARLQTGIVDANLTVGYYNQNDNSGNDTVSLGVLPFDTGIARGGLTGLDPRHVASAFGQTIRKEETSAELNVKLDLGKVALSSVSTYAKLNNVLSFDGDGSSAVLVDAYIPERAKTYSQELQLSSSTDGPIDWITGVYYYNDNTGYDIVIDQGTRVISQGVQTVKSESYAGFGQVGWKFTDHLKLIVGGRYTKDKKSLTLRPSTLGINVSPPNAASQSWSKFTPSATLQYSIDDTLAYAKFARGFKSGGFNYPFTVGSSSVRPEVLDMYELGLKTSVFDRKVRLSLSGYYYDYKDLQVSRAATAGSALIITQNAANAKLYGIDGDVAWNPAPGLTLSGGFAWQHSEYKNYDLATAKVYLATLPANAGSAVVVPGMTDVAFAANGQSLLRAPKFSGYVSLNYDISAGAGVIPVSLSYSYKGAFNFDFIAQPQTSVLRQKGYSLVNARIGYRPLDEGWEVSVWGNNLFNQNYFDDVVASGTGIRGSYGAPRTYGIEASFHF